ncbi:MAG: carbohydrate ABC transporter permease [Chloroflexota bacterium]
MWNDGSPTSDMASIARRRSGDLTFPRPVWKRQWLLTWLAYGGLIAVVLAVGIPTYWMLVAAFKTQREIYTFPPSWIPLAPTLNNFADAWNAAPFGRYYLNSVLVTVVVGGVKMLNAIFCAYAFAYLRFPGRDGLFLVVLAALMIPEEITILPNYLTVAGFGWLKTYAALMVPGFASAFGTFMLRQHFLSLPREVLDAAKMDGAGHLRTLWSVVLPMSRPVLVTLLLLTVVQRWNDFLWPLIATDTADMRTLAIGIYYLFAQEGQTIWGVVMAGTLFVVAPVLALFLLVQRHIVDGMTAGAVKG